MAWNNLTDVSEYYGDKLTSVSNKIVEKGGEAVYCYEDIEDGIDSIPAGCEDISTSAEMDALLNAENDGKVFHYVGTTTSAYINDGYYRVTYKGSYTMALSGFTSYGFEDSPISITGVDLSKYELRQSNNYQKNSTNAVAKITLIGFTTFEFYINSYGETNYDYTIVSKLDATSYPTSYSQTNVKEHTRGFSKDPTQGLEASWKKVTFTSEDGLDGGTHTFWINYHKDTSAHSGNDRGYFLISKLTAAFAEFINCDGDVSITANGTVSVKGKSNAVVNVPQGVFPSGSYSITSNGTYDVTNYASAVVDVAGGASGHKIYYYHCGTDDGGYISLDGGDALKLIQQMPDTSYTYSNSSAIICNVVSTIKLWGFDHIGTYPTNSSSWARYRQHLGDTWTNINLTSDEASAITITLTSDIDLEIYEGTCLSKGTLISMADGTKKPVEEIEVGDYVMGYTGSQMVRRSQKGFQQYWEDRDIWKFENGYEVITCANHEFYNYEAQKMMYLVDWKIGDRAVTENGELVRLLEHIHEDIPCMHFSLWCYEENYYANGLLAGNRFTEQMEIK